MFTKLIFFCRLHVKVCSLSCHYPIRDTSAQPHVGLGLISGRGNYRRWDGLSMQKASKAVEKGESVRCAAECS